ARDGGLHVRARGHPARSDPHRVAEGGRGLRDGPHQLATRRHGGRRRVDRQEEGGAVIRFQHVSKEYPRTGLVLQDVSLFVAKGEFVFLTGPSGAGKSSLLKLIYMEELPTKGDVWVSGVRAKGVNRKEIAKLRRKLGVVFQDFRLLRGRPPEGDSGGALPGARAPR